MDASPIELNFYNESDEVIETHRRSRIPSYLLDMAINLQQQLNAGDGENQQSMDMLFDFIVEFYGSKFTREDVRKKQI